MRGHRRLEAAIAVTSLIRIRVAQAARESVHIRGRVTGLRKNTVLNSISTDALHTHVPPR